MGIDSRAELELTRHNITYVHNTGLSGSASARCACHCRQPLSSMSNLAYNVSLDDGDPQISYSGNWVTSPNVPLTGNPSGATETSYFNDSIHYSITTGSSASLTFTGIFT